MSVVSSLANEQPTDIVDGRLPNNVLDDSRSGLVSTSSPGVTNTFPVIDGRLRNDVLDDNRFESGVRTVSSQAENNPSTGPVSSLANEQPAPTHDRRPPSERRARQGCQRGRSEGADGVFIGNEQTILSNRGAASQRRARRQPLRRYGHPHTV
jgi:hypothetical protein